jgi:hypothetical protein
MNVKKVGHDLEIGKITARGKNFTPQKKYIYIIYIYLYLSYSNATINRSYIHYSHIITIQCTPVLFKLYLYQSIRLSQSFLFLKWWEVFFFLRQWGVSIQFFSYLKIICVNIIYFIFEENIIFSIEILFYCLFLVKFSFLWDKSSFL